MSAGPGYQDWDANSNDYHNHVAEISRMTSINPDLPRYPTVHKAFNHRVIPLQETNKNRGRSGKKKPPRRVHISEQGTVIDEDNGDLDVEEGDDDDAAGLMPPRRFELCKWKTFKL